MLSLAFSLAGPAEIKGPKALTNGCFGYELIEVLRGQGLVL